MSRRWILIALATAMAVLGAACGGDSGDAPAESPTASAEPEAGGTLNIALISDVQDAFDPQKEYSSVTWEYYRCCLLRTLLSYNGRTTDEGGSELRPDLAAELPTVSDDGLTWTFTLKPGIKYAPPLQDVSVTAQDFVRAMEREACGACNVGGYSFYYSPIEGFDEFAAGEADTISGLDAPDDSTFVVTLNEPTGDLGVPSRDAGVGADPADARRPEGASRRGDGPRRGLGAVPGRDRAIHVRGLRSARLLEARPGADAGGRLFAGPLDRARSQPVVGRLDR